MDNDPLLDRWMGLWRRLGAEAPELAETGISVISAYEGSGRFYHTRKHLEDVLNKLDWAKTALAQSGDLAGIPAHKRVLLFDTIELALWYHDVIYDAKEHGNERKSRELFLSDAAKLGLPDDTRREVAMLIDVTAGHKNARRLDERILCDCDLAILGAPKGEFEEYDRNIRKEYAHVPEPAYAAARRRVLGGFASGKHIFKTRAFQDKFEAPARHNIGEKTRPLLSWLKKRLYGPFCQPRKDGV